jgi:polyphosphate kinase 2 (PPK2 family)
MWTVAKQNTTDGNWHGKTPKPNAPWHVVPADDKENARLIVSQIVLDALDDLKLAYPKTTAKRRQELKSIHNRL